MITMIFMQAVFFTKHGKFRLHAGKIFFLQNMENSGSMHGKGLQNF